MTDLRARLLQAMQDGFPLTSRPFYELGGRFSLNEAEVIALVQEGLVKGTIRRIGGVVVSANLGYSSALCAARIPEARLAEAVKLINAYPEVTHHYLREHSHNVWFTLIAPSRERVLELEADIARGLGFPVIDLPARKVYKIRADFILDESANRPDGRLPDEKSGLPLTAQEKKLIQLVQGTLPVVSYPFAEWCAESGLEEAELLGGIQALMAKGRLRRFGAVLGHRKIGYVYNMMVLWPVTLESADSIAEQFTAWPEVSHCYLRGPFENQPWWIFTMLHARDKQALEALRQAMAEASGITDSVGLLSLREFKKTSMQYF